MMVRRAHKSTLAFTLAACVCGALMCAVPASAATKLAPGNTLVEQPTIPGASKNRTRALKTTFEAKYQRVLAFLKKDKKLVADIKKISKKFGIDPIHMIGAIVGEHTYNVDVLDRAQSYYFKALNYLKSDIDFEYKGESIDKFVQRPEFEKCDEDWGSERLWTCRENVWNAEFRGKTVEDKSFPNNRFSAVFFQPFYAGQTFGIGQMNPLTALMMTDEVNKKTRSRKLNASNGKQIYKTIMDPKATLPYIAATLASSIDHYKKIAGYDISENPGITATLYNTGNARGRAQSLAAKNKKLKAEGKKPIVPQVNYYGWLINDKEAELRDLL